MIGATTRRADETGIRAALAAFQTAAGVLEILARELDREAKGQRTASSKIGGDGDDDEQVSPTDLNEKVVGTLRTLCLAQAQEVAWQKAVMGTCKDRARGHGVLDYDNMNKKKRMTDLVMKTM